MTSPTNQLGHPSPTPVTSPSVPQQVSPSASSGPSVAASAATSSAAQQQSSPSASSGNSLTTVATSPSVAQGSHPLNQLTSPAASTGVPAASLSPGLKDQNVSSPKSVTQQPCSSTSSAVQKPASSTRPGSINTSVAPSAGSMSPTTSKTSLSLPPGSIDKVSKPTTTLTPGAGQTSLGQGSMSTKPGIADQSPTSVQPSAPTSGHQTTSSRPGHQHPNDTFQNEVICEDQVQNSWPIISLKEAKTCAEWKTLTLNSSLFKTFCSTARYAYDPSRDKCTVTLASPEPRSRRWAVRAVVHLHLDPEKVFEELKEKRDELDKLGITNVTFHDEQLEEEIKDRFSTPLIITIITLAGSLLLVAAIYGCCHQRFSHKKDQVSSGTSSVANKPCWARGIQGAGSQGRGGGWDGLAASGKGWEVAVPQDVFAPEVPSGAEELQHFHLSWRRHPPLGLAPPVRSCWVTACTCRAILQQDEPIPRSCRCFGGAVAADGAPGGSSKGKEQGNEGLVVSGRRDEQHPSHPGHQATQC
uniref:Podocalyxin n=1 Tax=Apteryx owenii TaxID=8824 RepID=A0A8B9Q8X0_APTOW